MGRLCDLTGKLSLSTEEFRLVSMLILRIINIDGPQKNGPHGADPVVAEQRQTANLLASSAFAPFCGRVPKHGPRIHNSHCAGKRRRFSTATRGLGRRRPPPAS